LTTLSKNALYAPLKSYIKDEGGSSNTSVNRNLKEKSLYSFLESVSEEYHSSRTLLGLENGAKNGGQGLKARHIEAKLGQRALSLIKGGIRTDVAKSTSDLDSTNEKPKPSSKRKRSNQIVRLHGSISHTKRKKVCKSIKKEKTNFTIVGGVLVGLNSMWNQYAQSLLSKAYLNKKQKLLDISEAASLMSTAELVGSFVRISRCQPCLSYQGKSGFLVDVTKNTWRIALPKDGSIMNEKNIKDITDATMFKCMIIPKQGTCIILYIPANEEKSNQGIKIQVSG
jgi:RNase P/RNase MRP subunit p29